MRNASAGECRDGAREAREQERRDDPAPQDEQRERRGGEDPELPRLRERFRERDCRAARRTARARARCAGGPPNPSAPIRPQARAISISECAERGGGTRIARSLRARGEAAGVPARARDALH